MPIAPMPPVMRKSICTVSAGIPPEEAQAFQAIADRLGKSRNYLLRRYIRFAVGISDDLPIGYEMAGEQKS